MATPLNELLSRALVGVTRAYEAVDPGAPSLPLLMVGLRLFGGTVDTKTAHLAARTSKRAMVTIMKQLTRAGYVTIGDKTAKLTAFGRRERARGLAALAVAEQKFAPLLAPLTALVESFELELPHYWITYGGSDWSLTGGRWKAGVAGPPRIPASGTEWYPVLRDGGDSVAGLPLTALLAQALCNFAVDYEDQITSLGLTIHGLLPIDPKRGTPFDDVPRFAHLTGDGRSALERHGIVRVVGAKPNRVAKLTPIAVRARAAYPAGVAAVEDRWRDVYGDRAVTRLRKALEQVAPPGPAHPHLDWMRELREDSIP